MRLFRWRVGLWIGAWLVLGLGARTARADVGSSYRVRPQVELGGLALLSHRVAFGRNGTSFDYVRDGGQDNVFFVARLSADLELAGRHTVVLLYQPLELSTRAQLRRELVVDEVTFAQGTPMAFTYGFPFYRVSYLYDLLGDPRHELSIGGSLQIRNATIEFASTDGAQLKSYRDIGLVPLIKVRGHYALDGGYFLGAELDGIYAPIRGANGSDNEVTGALLDASLRAGVELPHDARIFLNLRYLGGGATGQSDPEPFSDGRTKNWIHLVTVTVGGNIAAP